MISVILLVLCAACFGRSFWLSGAPHQRWQTAGVILFVCLITSIVAEVQS